MTRGNSLSTAHQAWDRRWQDENTRRNWLEPEPLVAGSLPLLRELNVATVLDIGCGIGRHALYLSKEGFRVTGLDLSRSGLRVANDMASNEDEQIALGVGDFTHLPVVDDSFDLALAWNVIYHGDRDIASQAISEIRRVLRPGGLFLGTMISTRHVRYGDGREIRPDTFVVEDDDEKAHAHFYCDDRALVELLDGFQLFVLQDREQRERGTWHWEFIAELRTST